jgi:ABC-type lipoprotein release transport system permease subunit
MQPKIPAGRKKAARSGGHLLSLYSRLILLNIRSDLKRVIVTIVSVTGCCALVVIGFTLKSAVIGALENQYTRIVDFDGRIKFDTKTAENAAEEISQRLKSEGVDYTELYDGVVTFRVTENLVGELLCGDIAEISEYYHLLDWKTGEPLPPSDDGILVQKRTAETYDLEVGSELELTLGSAESAKVRVAGIFDNYIGRVMAMSPAYYQKVFGRECATNAFYVRLNGTDEQALLDSLQQIDGYESYSPSDEEKTLFASSAALVNVIVALFIFMAAIMAGVVLTNLTNTYILQKKRELTIMRINGFTVREVISYVSRETVVTTILGIMFGVAAGAGLSYKITRALESVFIQYDRSVSYTAWLYGVLITLFFTVIINIIVLRPIRNLKLTDVT